MNPMSLSAIRDFWLQSNYHPSKRLGQNFLIDKNIKEIILGAAALNADDAVIEIGPGLGALTYDLARQVKTLVAVEKDRRLHKHLAKNLDLNVNSRLINADALELDYAELFPEGAFKLIANLPYATGTAILVKFWSLSNPPARIVVTLQQEVAQRIAAEVSSPQYGLLAVWAGLRYSVDLVKSISPTCFWPVPAVTSAAIRLERGDPVIDLLDFDFFFELTKQAFAHRRKQIKTVLRKTPLLAVLSPRELADLLRNSGIDPAARPENLSTAEWGILANQAYSFRKEQCKP